MEDKRSVIISAIVGIVVLALIIGVIIYLIRFITNRSGASLRPTPQVSATVEDNGDQMQLGDETDQPNPEPNASNPPAAGTKKYQGRGFEIVYPSNWGLLSCKNSTNVELDPTNPADQKNVNCDYAIKSVTILVGSNSCQGGENVNKGGVIFTREKKQTSTGVNYKWCTQTNPTLEITHRVSNDESRATSKQDFAGQVEDLISRIRFGSI